MSRCRAHACNCAFVRDLHTVNRCLLQFTSSQPTIQTINRPTRRLLLEAAPPES